MDGVFRWKHDEWYEMIPNTNYYNIYYRPSGAWRIMFATLEENGRWHYCSTGILQNYEFYEDHFPLTVDELTSIMSEVVT